MKKDMTLTVVIVLSLLLLVVGLACVGTDPKIEASYEDHINGCYMYPTPSEQDTCIDRVNTQYGRK